MEIVAVNEMSREVSSIKIKYTCDSDLTLMRDRLKVDNKITAVKEKKIERGLFLGRDAESTCVTVNQWPHLILALCAIRFWKVRERTICTRIGDP